MQLYVPGLRTLKPTLLNFLVDRNYVVPMAT